MAAENIYQVFDWLWSSGQLSEHDISTLPSLGIKAVVNLALPTSTNALPGEAELVTRHGMAYIQIPVEWEAPQLKQFQQFVGVLNTFRNTNIWVHCAKNMRVSTFIYLYRRLVLGESKEESAFPMNLVWSPNDTRQSFIDTVFSNEGIELANLRSERKE